MNAWEGVDKADETSYYMYNMSEADFPRAKELGRQFSYASPFDVRKFEIIKVRFSGVKLKTMSREDALKLIEATRNKVGNEELSKYLDCSGMEKTDLEVDLLGVTNGFLSEIVHVITGYEVEVCGSVEELFICPCCGFRTLTECYDPMEGTGYDICPYCNWEDDGTTDIYSYRSINRGSIQDYRDKMQANPNRYYINKWMKG